MNRSDRSRLFTGCMKGARIEYWTPMADATNTDSFWIALVGFHAAKHGLEPYLMSEWSTHIFTVVPAM